MKQFWVATVCAVLLAIPVFAQDEPLPEAVAQAYVEYEEASRAGDVEAATDAARRAWRAARSARIDRGLIGILAANYGELALATGDFENAHDALMEAARQGDRVGEAAPERALRWYRASLAAYGAGRVRDARRCSRQSARALDDLEPAQLIELRGDTQYMIARTSAQLGSFGPMGDAAREAIEAFTDAGRPADVILAHAYYLSGVDNFFWGEREESAFDFHLAHSIWSEADNAASEDTVASDFWYRLSVADLDQDARDRLGTRIANSAYPMEEEVETEERRIERQLAEGRVDASPRMRIEPRYPMDVAAAGIEGIVLVRFDIDEEGRTDNIDVSVAAPAGFFEEVSRDAVARWEYNPATLHGVPVRRPGVETQFIFQMCEDDCDARRSRNIDEDAQGEDD